MKNKVKYIKYNHSKYDLANIINIKYFDNIISKYIEDIFYEKNTIEILYIKPNSGKKTLYQITFKDIRKYKINKLIC